MRLKVLLFFIILLRASILIAQTNFVKGYYITNTQDTVHGYIDYRSERRNYELCIFKGDLESKSMKFLPQNILGFTVDDKDFYELHSFKNRRGEELLGFFKVVLRGRLTLLRYHSKYFVKNLGGEIFEISKQNVISDGKIRTDYFGLGMLKVLMKDCGEITGRYLEMEYRSSPNFVDIFRKYNLCMGSPIYESEEIVIKTHIDYGLQIAPTIATLQFNPSLEQVKFKEDYSFGFGCFASIFLPKVNENFRLVVEPSYNSLNFYRFFNSGNTNNDLFVDFSSIKLPLIMRYNFKRFFFDMGIQNLVVFDQDLRWRVETIQQGTVNTTERQITPFNVWNSGYSAGVGLKFNLVNYPIRSSLRFSHVQSKDHPNGLVFQNFEFILNIQLSKEK